MEKKYRVVSVEERQELKAMVCLPADPCSHSAVER